MCNRLHHFAAAIAIFAGAALTAAQIPAPSSLHTNPAVHGAADDSDAPAAPDPPNDPVAAPRAIVVFGKARFTVLTAQLVRMEWAADGKFEDHASLVFINRRLPAPKLIAKIEYAGKVPVLEIKAAAVTLHYSPNPTRMAASRRTVLKPTL